jgi:hypothetical protein
VTITVAVGIVVPCVVVFSGDKNTRVNSSAAADESLIEETIYIHTRAISTSNPHVPLFTAAGTFEFLETVAHNASAFTQPHSLLRKYWSVSYGKSQVRIVVLQTGQVDASTRHTSWTTSILEKDFATIPVQMPSRVKEDSFN